MKKLLGAAAVAATLASANAHAALTLPTEISITPVETLAGVIFTALAGMWIIRKVVKTTNKS